MIHSRRVICAIIVCAWLSGCGAGGVPDNAVVVNQAGDGVTTPGLELLTFQVQLIAVDVRLEHDQQPLIVNVDDVVSGNLLIESSVVR